MDLMQVHNLQDWRTNLPTLREWKAAETIRISASRPPRPGRTPTGEVMRAEKLDFVQFNYSIGERESTEKVLLPLAPTRASRP